MDSAARDDRARKRWSRAAWLAGVMAGLLSASPVSAATFIVTTLDDGGSGSLRQAIDDANASPGADTIMFGVSAKPARS